MPQDIVHIDLTAETGARARDTNVDVGVIGFADTAPPDAEFGDAVRYTSTVAVSNDFGEDSDVHTASQALAQMGTAYWHVLVLETVETTETASTQLDNSPLIGSMGVDVDGVDDDNVIFVTDTPADPGADEIHINAATGEHAQGSNLTDPDITYHHASDWDSLSELEHLDVVGFADAHNYEAHIGQLDELVSWADGEDIGVVAAHENGELFESDWDAVESAHATFSYVPSGDVLAVAHKSADDVGSYVLGQLATNDPWFDPMYDGDGYPFATDFYRDSVVGHPSDAGTFEGGDEDAETGNTNVVISKSGVQVLSNSLTTAGSASDYAYWDIGRTQTFLADEITAALESARLKNDQIPFTEDGHDIIENVVTDTIDQYVGGLGQPLAEADVHVPSVDSLSETDIANRQWTGIEVDATLASNVHEFSMELVIGVA